MSVTSGFFNARNSDRTYDAVQMSNIFDGLINDGVYNSQGGYFMVTPQSGMVVQVATGRAWFDHSWTLNDAILPITLDPAELFLDRIDAIVIETNHDINVRENSIKVIKGTPSANPVKPTMVKTDDVKQYPLCYITVHYGVEAIVAGDIENTVGTTECPFVNGLIEKVTTDELIQLWRAEWERWSPEYQAEFAAWVETLHDILDTETASHLLNLIEDLSDEVDDKLSGVSHKYMSMSSYNALSEKTPNTLYHCWEG